MKNLEELAEWTHPFPQQTGNTYKRIHTQMIEFLLFPNTLQKIMCLLINRSRNSLNEMCFLYFSSYSELLK